MAYTYSSWSVVFGEQPTASKWNILGTNDASFNERIGSNFSSGTSSPIWWEEIGRTTLSGAGDTITVSSLGARKYLRVAVYIQATGGNTNMNMTFNNDGTALYSYNRSNTFGASADSTAASSIQLNNNTDAHPKLAIVEILNVSAIDKIGSVRTFERNTAGAATAPAGREMNIKWSNTSAQITRIDVTNNSTGDFAIGSEIVVLGHD